MRKTLLLLFLSMPIIVFSQTLIDDFVSVSFPKEPKVNDTILEGVRIKTIYINDRSEGYSVIKMKKGLKEEEINDMPHDKRSLKKFYKGNIEGLSKQMAESGYVLDESTNIEINGFKAYKSSFSNETTGANFAQFVHLVLNEFVYTIGYTSYTNYNENNRNEFLNSIEIDKSKNPTQFTGTLNAERRGYIIGKVVFYGGLAFLILWLRFRKKKK